MGKQTEYTNRLAEESSPYLLQHAHNPVDWYPWGDEAFDRAKTENKLVLISIGYSACHWCHVMEREAFENEEIARIMNNNFINIKVDREERPDVDQVYMTAIQLMTGQGGWPLNFFALPDGRPIYGGTYFPPDTWKSILSDLSAAYENQPQKFEEYAEKLIEGIKTTDVIDLKANPVLTVEDLKSAVRKWSKRWDLAEGGPNHAPKFPMPNNYLFLLKYAYINNDTKAADYVKLTLEKMAYGGIYDQVGGGFARYSTDMLWKVPHFEKMLYDNAQLVSLYSEAYQATGNQLFKSVVYETLEFIGRELTSPEGAFYSALDADTEGEEGKFYVWTDEELKLLLGNRYDIAKEYFNINSHGAWEGNYILLRRKSDKEVAKKLKISEQDLHSNIKEIKAILLKAREKRVKPGLDDKSLTSWNALMLLAYVDAYKVFNEQKFLGVAMKNARFLISNVLQEDGSLYHSYKNGKATIAGFLEDYAFTIEALINLYEATFDFQWLQRAKKLTDYCIENFFNKETGLFWFTSKKEKPLITRKYEIADNVIPASNSSMAKSLFIMGRYFEGDGYNEISLQMIARVKKELIEYGASYSNWGIVMLWNLFPFYEIVISGIDAEFKRKEFTGHYIPNKLIAGSTTETDYPLFRNRFHENKTTIYVCVNQKCKLPVHEVDEAMAMITAGVAE
jgi:uncharacterized protein